MKLHRASSKAEWANVPAHSRNIWQQIADSTFGVVTPGNAVSLVGLLSVPYGLWFILAAQEYRLGALVLVLGRLCDLLDGWLADKTATKSPLGEIIDASFDKISIAATVIGLAYGNIISGLVLVLLLGPHVITGIFALFAWLKNLRLHPSRIGKIGMATAWVCLLAFTVLQDYRVITDNFAMAISVSIIAYALLFVSVALGVVAMLGYIDDYKTAAKKS